MKAHLSKAWRVMISRVFLVCLVLSATVGISVWGAIHYAFDERDQDIAIRVKELSGRMEYVSEYVPFYLVMRCFQRRGEGWRDGPALDSCMAKFKPIDGEETE